MLHKSKGGFNMKKICVLIFIALGILMMAGCGESPKYTHIINLNVPDQLVIGEPCDFAASIDSDEIYNVNWSSTAGEFTGDVSNLKTSWKAPAEAEKCTIVFEAISKIDDLSVLKSIEVLEPPLAVTSVTSTYSYDRIDVKVVLQNNSDKNIGAYKLKIALWNAFDERVYISRNPFQHCYSDDIYFKPGETGSFTAPLSAKMAVRAEAYVYQVKYKDGSEWKVEYGI